MAEIIRRVNQGLSTIALLSVSICIFGLVYALIQNPELFVSTKNVISFVVEVLLLGRLTAYFAKRIKQGIREHGSFTTALVKLVAQEPLIHSLMWIFVLFVAIYILPIHYVAVELYDRESSEPVASSLVASAEITKGDGVYEMSREMTSSTKFTSKRFLTWGTQANVVVKARGYEDIQRVVPWTAFALIDVFRGNRQELLLTKVAPDSVRFSLSAQPASAQFAIESPIGSQPALSQGATTFVARKDESLKISVTADCYRSFDTTLVAAEDADLRVTLHPRPGRVRLRAFKENGAEVKAMSIFINGRPVPEKTGEWIALRAGTYDLRLFQQLTESLQYEIKASFRILSCETIERSFTVAPEVLTVK